MTEEQNTTNEPSTVKTVKTVKIPCRKTMSEAALAANRANAKKCTGPKILEGNVKCSKPKNPPSPGKRPSNSAS